MSVQTSYSSYHDPALKGMVADGQLSNAVSKHNPSASVIPYGTGVVTSGENGCAAPVGGSTAAEFIGVVKYEVNRARVSSSDTGGIPANQDGTIITVGTIWVTAQATVAKDDNVFLRVGTENKGDFSNAAGSGATASVQIPNAKWLTSANAGELAQISLKVGG